MRANIVIGLFLLSIIQSFAQNFNPSSEYVTRNKNNWTIELPEVQELVHIIMAISPTGIVDSNMVEHRSAYYRDVLKTFGPFKQHKIVKKVDDLLQDKLYAQVKMDACGFYFNEANRILKDKTYKQLNWGDKNFIQPYIHELEDFARKSGFRQFYAAHKNYYDALIEKMKVQMPINNQWKWLEERFPNRYDNYRITFSPLVNGSHSTNRFERDNFKQTVMFICGPIESTQLSEKIKEGLMTRVVFTEIDHNYVNPVSDRYQKEIHEIFSDRKKWTSEKDSQNYGSAYAVFNEYMTWAVFSLYALETFDEADFKIINARTELQMSNWRGFTRFKAFNQKMIELYNSKSADESIADLYPKILAWCEANKHD